MKARIVVEGTDGDLESLRVWLSREPALRGRVSLDGTDLVVIASMSQTPAAIVWGAVAKAVAVWLHHRRTPVSAIVIAPSGRRAAVSTGAAAEAESVVSAVLRAPAAPPADSGDPATTLRECRDTFGSPPRYFDQSDIDGYLRVGQPEWLAALGRLVDARYYHDWLAWQGELRRTGRVVWGCIVQANTLLFEPGEENNPAVFLYSLDPAIDAAPERLRAIARSLYGVKGLETDPELQRFADALADERAPIGRLAVPAAVCGGVREVFYTVALVVRNHLPDGVLQSRPFPLLVLPEQTTATMILPSRYWSKRLLAQWQTM